MICREQGPCEIKFCESVMALAAIATEQKLSPRARFKKAFVEVSFHMEQIEISEKVRNKASSYVAACEAGAEKAKAQLLEKEENLIEAHAKHKQANDELEREARKVGEIIDPSTKTKTHGEVAIPSKGQPSGRERD